LRLLGEIERVGADTSPGKRLEREGRHELARVLRHHDLDGRPELPKLPHEVARLVAGNAAGETDEDATSFEGHASGTSWRRCCASSLRDTPSIARATAAEPTFAVIWMTQVRSE